MKIYQVDAFTKQKYQGNPAGVCLLPKDTINTDKWMQSVAAEMNLSETAFLQEKKGNIFSLRWFTPKTEVKLCGHGTLATSHVLWTEGLLDKDKAAKFDTLSGRLTVTLDESSDGAMMTMKFPSVQSLPCKEPVGLEMALDCDVINTFMAGESLLVEIEDEDVLRKLEPYIQQLATIPARNVIVTAKSNSVDFVSRVFGPNVGIDEDPVTGSAHCVLAPFWAERLGKTKMNAQQLSNRGGELLVALNGKSVEITGQAVTIFRGELCE